MSAWVSFPRLNFFTIFTFSSLFPQYVKEVLCFALAKSIFGCGAERCSRLPWAALGSSRGAGVRVPPEVAGGGAASRRSSGVLTPAANLQFVLFGNRDQVSTLSIPESFQFAQNQREHMRGTWATMAKPIFGRLKEAGGVFSGCPRECPVSVGVRGGT